MYDILLYLIFIFNERRILMCDSWLCVIDAGLVTSYWCNPCTCALLAGIKLPS